VDGTGFWESIGHDLSGKGQFRLIVQPIMAVVLGARLGVIDARGGAAPFLRRLIGSRHQRWRILGNSIRYVWMPLLLALVMDCVLQRLTLGRIRPLAAVVVGALLVWLPFAITRGATNRIWRWSRRRRSTRERQSLLSRRR
jgi:hypothetical protein